MSINKLNYVLQIADNALVLGHRISEWCGHGPVLEQDIALTNTSLDHIGQARSLYQYAADLYNQLSAEDKSKVFESFEMPENKAAEEDSLPYLRDAWDYRNVLLVEQPNEDWAYTTARSFFYDSFMVLFWKALMSSNDETLVAIAEKSLKEAQYHLRWSSEWVIRLGDGTEESHQKMQTAVDDLWSYSGELFIASDADKAMLAAGTGLDLDTLRSAWMNNVKAIFEEATLVMPDSNAWMHRGAKQGKHSEHLGFILAELQFVQRAYPNMSW